MSSINQYDYVSRSEANELLRRLENYIRDTNSSSDTVFTVAQISRCFRSHVRRGGACSTHQRDKLERMMDQYPGGVTLKDVQSKAISSAQIEARRDEAQKRRAAHVEKCRQDYLRKYGEDPNWQPVEGMAA